MKYSIYLYPKISIITPSFNQGEYIEKTIQSVLAQDYPNLEFIIIDGGSTDNSVAIIKRYEHLLTYWTSEKDGGQAAALNKGFEKATGDIIAWINSDDWYEPDTFKAVATFFSKNQRAKLLIGNCIVHFADLAKKTHLIKPRQVTFASMLNYLEPYFCPPQPSIFFSGKYLRQGYRVDETLNYAMDLDLWLRMSRATRFHYLDKNFSNYLIHDLSKSGEGFDKFVNEWKQVCQRHYRTAPLNIKINRRIKTLLSAWRR